jgi:UDPglucose 6-dehydrogenase
MQQFTNTKFHNGGSALNHDDLMERQAESSGLVESVQGLGAASGLVKGTSLCVVGGGFVGLVTASGFAQFGHTVTCVEYDQEKLKRLETGQVPFFERDLESLLRQNMDAARLTFCGELTAAVKGQKAIFVTVGTPSAADGRSDLSALHRVIDTVAPVLEDGQIIVLKSTVPVGTGQEVQNRLNALLTDGRRVTVVNNPEFLREGTAVHDFFHPQRIVIGGEPESVSQIAQLYRIGMTTVIPIVTVNHETAELIKYASNAFIALKVGFINELSGLCDRTGINVLEVARAMGMDPRIGDEYLVPGPGWGGSCLGKDLRELEGLARSQGYTPEIVSAIQSANTRHHQHVVDRIGELTGPLNKARIAVLGLAFKAGTSDVRESPALEIAKRLLASGAEVTAYDPEAGGEARQSLPELSIADSPYDATAGAHCLVILTEWPHFQSLDFARLAKSMESPTVLDARNLLIPEIMRRYGFTYLGMGQV